MSIAKPTCGEPGSSSQASVSDDVEQRSDLFELVARALGREERSFATEFGVALDRLGLAKLSRASKSMLESATGLGAESCSRLEAIFRIGRRVEEVVWSPGDKIRSSACVHRLMAPVLRGLEKERFFVLLLDGRHHLRSRHRISEGTLTTSLVHPREVFAPAIRELAAAIIVAHNHPSGDPEPSAEDLEVTRRLARCGKLLGIPLLDHLVVGTGSFVSIRERIQF